MKHCLVEKLLSSRTIVPNIIKNTFSNAWRTNLSFNVDSLGRNLYFFKFDAKRDKEMGKTKKVYGYDKRLPDLFDERLPDFCYGCGRIGHMIKECRTFNKETEKDPEGWQFRSWLRFQGLNPRRRRKASPQRDEKEKSPFDSSMAKAGSFSSNETIAESIGKTSEERRRREKEEGINQRFQIPSSHIDLNLGPQEVDFIRDPKEYSPGIAKKILIKQIWLASIHHVNRLLSPLL
ncbi:unnamed protein product [Citrullus colocynthis]|uniref:CCHC-type domain-containing protein n=1 Tax=Citrullus colocynthis TaxID=252529 RepID=A0ABP0Z8T4_9ROSI